MPPASLMHAGWMSSASSPSRIRAPGVNPPRRASSGSIASSHTASGESAKLSSRRFAPPVVSSNRLPSSWRPPGRNPPASARSSRACGGASNVGSRRRSLPSWISCCAVRGSSLSREVVMRASSVRRVAARSSLARPSTTRRLREGIVAWRRAQRARPSAISVRARSAARASRSARCRYGSSARGTQPPLRLGISCASRQHMRSGSGSSRMARNSYGLR